MIRDLRQRFKSRLDGLSIWWMPDLFTNQPLPTGVVDQTRELLKEVAAYGTEGYRFDSHGWRFIVGNRCGSGDDFQCLDCVMADVELYRIPVDGQRLPLFLDDVRPFR